MSWPTWLTRDRLSWSLSLLLAALIGLLFWSTASSTSLARVAALQPVDPGSFAVYHQIVHNLAMDGVFEQTLHPGYDDSWTWSGHRAPGIFVTAALYRLHPGAIGLAQVQILLLLLGAVPAGVLGYQALQRRPGGVLMGVAVYLGTPTTLAMALQDYQDLVLALPATLALACTLRARHWGWVPLGVLVALLPREETAALVVPTALLLVPWQAGVTWRERVRWRRWALNVVVCAALAGLYMWGVEVLFPAQGTEYKMQLASTTRLSGSSTMLQGWLWLDSFYADLAWPVGWLGLFAPLAALPGLLVTAYHLTIGLDMGIDRHWSGHSHHMAPALAFFTTASLDGLGRLFRWSRGLPGGRVGPRLAQGLLALLVAGLLAQGGARFAEDQNLRVELLPRGDTWVHPAWGLARQIPQGAVPVAPRALAPVVADRRGALTYDDSLRDKARERGLAAATHALVDTRQQAAVAWIEAMPGAQRLDEDGPFALYSWSPGRDPSWTGTTPSLTRAPDYLGPYRRAEEIPGVPVSARPEVELRPVPSLPRPPAWLLALERRLRGPLPAPPQAGPGRVKR